MKNQESKEIELDVVSLFKTLWRRKFSILITALLFAIGALGYSAFVAKKIYQSTSRIYVVSRQNQENNALTNQDLQAGSYLVKDYREIILSQNVLNQAIEELKLEMTPAELAKKVSVAVPADTRIHHSLRPRSTRSSSYREWIERCSGRKNYRCNQGI